MSGLCFARAKLHAKVSKIELIMIVMFRLRRIWDSQLLFLENASSVCLKGSICLKKMSHLVEEDESFG